MIEINLYKKDKEIASFSIKEFPLFFIIETINIYEKDKMPFSLEDKDDDEIIKLKLKHWLINRYTDDLSDKYLIEKLGLQHNAAYMDRMQGSEYVLTLLNYARNINDDYWINPKKNTLIAFVGIDWRFNRFYDWFRVT